MAKKKSKSILYLFLVIFIIEILLNIYKPEISADGLSFYKEDLSIQHKIAEEFQPDEMVHEGELEPKIYGSNKLYNFMRDPLGLGKNKKENETPAFLVTTTPIGTF